MEDIKESKPVRYYTEEQVKELLKEQRLICNSNYESFRFGKSQYFSSSHSIEEARTPEFPEPIACVPVDKVKEVMDNIYENSSVLSGESETENKVKMGIIITLDLIKEKLLPDGK